jgi:hypothetical protein
MFVPAPLHGFAFWFDVDFNGPVHQKSQKQASQSLDWNKQNASPSSKKKKQDVYIVLSTAPEDAPTHWQQVIVFQSNNIFASLYVCFCLIFPQVAMLTTTIFTGFYFGRLFCTYLNL